MRNRDREITTDEAEIRRYKNLEDIQTDKEGYSLRDAINAEKIGNVAEPAMEEIQEVKKTGKNGRTSRNNDKNAELIKYEGKGLRDKNMWIDKRHIKRRKDAKKCEEGMIVTIHRKRDHTDCKNYKDVMLLTAAYKILTAIIQKQIPSAAKTTNGDY